YIHCLAFQGAGSLNKNMSLLIDYKINLIDESEFTKKAGVATDNILAVGMMYQF
ncbi:TPA: porin, partial [Escherichia coli]